MSSNRTFFFRKSSFSDENMPQDWSDLQEWQEKYIGITDVDTGEHSNQQQIEPNWQMNKNSISNFIKVATRVKTERGGEDDQQNSQQQQFQHEVKRRKKRQGRHKNVPYTFGRHFRNWIEGEILPLGVKKSLALIQFLKKRKDNPRYHDSFKDFNELFAEPGIGRQLGQIFFGQKLWLSNLMDNERVGNLTPYFQVEQNYYLAAKTGEKITEQKVRIFN